MFQTSPLTSSPCPRLSSQSMSSLTLVPSQIRFLGDPSGKFTETLDLTFDSAAIFGNNRSKRYALVVEDGKVKSAHVEPDNTGVDGTYPVTDCLAVGQFIVTMLTCVQRSVSSGEGAWLDHLVVKRNTNGGKVPKTLLWHHG